MCERLKVLWMVRVVNWWQITRRQCETEEGCGALQQSSLKETWSEKLRCSCSDKAEVLRAECVVLSEELSTLSSCCFWVNWAGIQSEKSKEWRDCSYPASIASTNTAAVLTTHQMSVTIVSVTRYLHNVIVDATTLTMTLVQDLSNAIQRTLVQHFARFQPTRRVARSLGDSQLSFLFTSVT